MTRPANVRYLTGFSGSNGQVLITADGGEVLITDPRYDERAAAEAPELERIISRSPVKEALGRLADTGVTVLGFEAGHLDWRAGEALRVDAAEAGVDARPADDPVEALRVVKDAHELAALREACRITAQALQQCLEDLRPGASERDTAISLEATMRELGAEDRAFDSIVAFGEHSAIPHHEPGDRTLRPGDLIKIDCGARVAGYHADCTRTAALGDPGTELRTVHDVVRAAQAAGVAAAVADTTAGAVDAACREPITAAGYGEQFVHGTGHGVGLAIHEAPAVAREVRATLAPATVITVEPGIYLPGTGGVRIEDTVVVTEVGPAEVLTIAPRELLVL